MFNKNQAVLVTAVGEGMRILENSLSSSREFLGGYEQKALRDTFPNGIS